MSTTARLAAFAVALLVAFGVGFGIGDAVGPFEDAPPHEEPAGHDGWHGSPEEDR